MQPRSIIKDSNTRGFTFAPMGVAVRPLVAVAPRKMASTWPWAVPGYQPAPKPLLAIGEYSFSVVIRIMHRILSLVLANFNSLRAY